MISLFLGLSTANILLMSIVFGLGLFAVDGGDQATEGYRHHVTLGIASGFMAGATHLGVYMYFMATSKWLGAACDKANLNPTNYVRPALEHKKRVLKVVLLAIGVTMLAMFAGAGTDPTMGRQWSSSWHLVLAVLALGTNLVCAVLEYPRIRQQGALMDSALEKVNRLPTIDLPPGVS